ncbi:uncharacterized protein RhoGAP102A isoform X2 [Palaemon carinicauda]|uniref:uncharacterized protein RhoGAP102A isoform X2 n=1 Tax=Palaemon carinicauda TaxID=392227 RepID=UPI0035B5CAC8
MEGRRRREGREGKEKEKEKKDGKEKDGKGGQAPKTTTAKLKERWLLTRKTWRYMSDAGKKLFPDGVNPQKTEDIPRVEEHFQKINNRNRDFILWPQPQESPRTARRRRKRLMSATSDTDTGDDYASTDDEILGGTVSHMKHRIGGAMGLSEGLEMGTSHGASSGAMEMSHYPGMMPFSGMSYGSGMTYAHGPLPSSAYSSLPASMFGRERLSSVGELRYDLPPELYQHLLRSYGSCNLQHVASRLMEEQLTEEDEYDEDSGELLELGGFTTRSVGAQTDPHLDMCVQTDDDATAEDMVKVGAECRSVTEAAAAAAQAEERALAQAQGLSQAQSHPQSSSPETSHSSTSVLKKLWQRRESTATGIKTEDQSASGKENAGKKLVSDKDREPPPPKGVVAAKLMWAEKAAAAQGLPIIGMPANKKPNQDKAQEKNKLKNVFKLGLKCDVDQGTGSVKKSVEKTKIDRFKTVNYDKTLRNIKSKWVPGSEDDEEFMKQFQYKGKEEKKVKKKFKCIQVGDPLPQWILAGFRINSPVEIIHQRRLSRRRISKADSSDFSSSECSMSVPPSLPTSPRYSITVTDEMGTRDLLVSEAEAFRLSQMGAHIMYKRSSIDASVDTSEFEQEGAMGGVPPYQRSISALQASGHLSQMMYNLRGRPSHPQVIPGGQGHRSSHQGLLQSFIPAVMQRTRSGGGSGQASRLVAKKIWRARSKSQSRASAGTTSIWTPMGGNTWTSVTGRVVTLENTTLLQLTELERLTLQQLAIAKLQALNLGCQIRLPREQSSSAVQKKKRPYLLKRKALTTGFFDSKKEETKGVNCGLVFGLSLTQCLENERSRSREAAEKAVAAAAATAAAAAASASSGTEETDPPLSRKSSHAGSQASFSSLIEGTKQSTTGSLESLNLERKRPSLVGGDLLPPGTTSPDLLTGEPCPQIPSLLHSCFKHLETNGMRTLGIFRVSSSKKRVRQLREEFDSGRGVNLNEDHCPHDVATLLKEFFRDLPEPLLTRELYEPLIKTQKIRNRKLQFEALQHLIQLMPTANRDTLHSLLNFLTAVAEHSTDQHTQTGETLHGNKMDSSNLATLFAPNILHMVKPGTETMSTTEMAVHAEERIDVINVVRTMIDHSKELFDVTSELLDEMYQHIMDTHPEALDVLLRRRCTGPDDRGQHLQELLASLLAPHRPQSCPSNVLDLDIDTSSSVFEGSECSSSLPRSPTDASHHHDFDRIRTSMDEGDGARIRKREEVVHEGAAIAQVEQSGRRRHVEEEDDGRGRRRDTGDVAPSSGSEERGWFRKREKSSSRELDRTSEERQPEKSRWFRKRDKSSSRGSEEKSSRREESDKKQKEKLRNKDESGDKKKGVETASKKRPGSTEKANCEDRGEHRPRSSSEQTVNQERLRVPEPTVRRLSSPEIDNSGVITASLKIPVPLSQASGHLTRSHETEIPFTEDGLGGDDKKKLYRSSPNKDGGSQRSDMTRQRSGSSDSYLGQPITGTMSFQPLNKKGGDKQSHDSVLSSSSADVFTLSPSPRNTPLSDLYASGASSPLSRTGSPPLWLSPDSGTPGLSPPNSPPPQTRRRGESRNNPIAHSVTHTFGTKPPSTPSKTKGAPSSGTSHGLFPIGRSKTADSIKVESYQSEISTTVSPESEGDKGNRKGIHGDVAREVKGHKESSGKRYTRRRYTGERHPTGHLPDVSAGTHSDAPSSGEGQTQLWKRWEIIASDPTEPETFV